MHAAANESSSVDQVIALVDAGRFAVAEAQIGDSLKRKGVSAAEGSALEFERERMRRIRLDFTLAAEDVKAQLRKQIPDLSADEFAAWDAAGLLEKKTIDGADALLQALALEPVPPECAGGGASRQDNPPSTTVRWRRRIAHHREMRDQAIQAARPASHRAACA